MHGHYITPRRAPSYDIIIIIIVIIIIIKLFTAQNIWKGYTFFHKMNKNFTDVKSAAVENHNLLSYLDQSPDFTEHSTLYSVIGISCNFFLENHWHLSCFL